MEKLDEVTLPDIALVGYKRTGKDTTADYLVEKYGYTKFSFADKLRELAWELDAVVGSDGVTYRAYIDTYGYDIAKNFPEFRQHLKDLGLACRSAFGEDFWINQLYGKLDDEAAPIVITDVRFRNEFVAVSLTQFVTVAISADSDDTHDHHPSEKDIGQLKRKCDWQLFNPKNDDLFGDIDQMVGSLC